MLYMTTEFKDVVRGNLEAISQGLELLSHLSDEQYVHIATPYVSSSIGAHFRHIVDIYLALINPMTEAGYETLVDYDVRRRGTSIEESRETAIEELNNITCWLESLLNEQFKHSADLKLDNHQVMMIKTEVTLTDSHSVILDSTLIRELVFVSSHAVHHFALINVIAKLQGITLNNYLGIAPATATYLRTQNSDTGSAGVLNNHVDTHLKSATNSSSNDGFKGGLKNTSAASTDHSIAENLFV